MQYKHTYLFLLLLFSTTITNAQQSDRFKAIKLLSLEKNVAVGRTVVLKFSTLKAMQPLLYCTNSYGSTIVFPIVDGNMLQYHIPKNICQKIGSVNWELIEDTTLLSGTFNINPRPEVATIETYIGPPSIQAGGNDYSMLVVIPTDSLDNPVPTNTIINTKHQFLNTEENSNIFTQHLIAYRNIYSEKESGRMLVSSESLGVNSKEFTINVMPTIASNFTILAKRPHDYADGNQVTTFTTSIIKDFYDNVVSDGTFVNFIITNKDKNILKTTGTTINGVAKAKIIHPDFEDFWEVKAHIDGIAESDTITLNYKQVINQFKVNFTNNNRQITVGPLQSFMKQMIPDGLQVELNIYKNNTLYKSLIKTTFNGYVQFNLKPAIYEDNSYNLVVKTAGLQKEFNLIKLW